MNILYSFKPEEITDIKILEKKQAEYIDYSGSIIKLNKTKDIFNLLV
jgi:hypothetical protein